MAGMLLLSCTKQDRENTVIDQEARIDSYISQLPDLMRVVRREGANRIVTEEGPAGADTLARGDSVLFHYAGYVFANGKGALFATSREEVAESYGFVTDGEPQKRKIDRDDLIPGLYNGLIGARKGEACQIVFSAKYGFGNTPVYKLPRLTPLLFEVWIEDVIKN